MTRAEQVSRIKEVRAIVQNLQTELRRLEALYISEIGKFCQHEFNDPWVYYDLNHDSNACSICGKKVVRNRDGEIE